MMVVDCVTLGWAGDRIHAPKVGCLGLEEERQRGFCKEEVGFVLGYLLLSI